jgi:hypothetical protein
MVLLVFLKLSANFLILSPYPVITTEIFVIIYFISCAIKYLLIDIYVWSIKEKIHNWNFANSSNHTLSEIDHSTCEVIRNKIFAALRPVGRRDSYQLCVVDK